MSSSPTLPAHVAVCGVPDVVREACDAIVRLQAFAAELPAMVTTVDSALLPVLARYAAALSAVAEGVYATTTLEAVERGVVAASDHPTTSAWIAATFHEAGVSISTARVHHAARALAVVRATGLTRPELSRNPHLDEGDCADGGVSDLGAFPRPPVSRWVTGIPLRDAVTSGRLCADLAGVVASCVERIQRFDAYVVDDEHLLIDNAVSGATRKDLDTIAEVIIDTYGKGDLPDIVRERRTRDRDLSKFVRNPRTGMWHASVRLDDLNHATVEAALNALSKPQPDADGGRDERTAGQRRADALIHLATLATRHDPRIPGTGTTAKVVVRITLPDLDLTHPAAAAAALAGLADSAGLPANVGHPGLVGAVAGGAPGRRRNPVAFTTFGHLLTGAETAALACTADLTAVIVTAAGRPLAVGRSRRTASPAQVIALTERDGGCTYPGCGMPAGWSDAHHLIEWADGGRTDLDNMCLLCRGHHRTVHRLGHRATISPGGVRWVRADGTPIGTSPRRSSEEPT